MRRVSVSEAKAHLSRLLKEVRSGEEILILDRGKPVARLVPAALPEGLEELVRLGMVRPGSGEVLDFAGMPRIPGLVEALLEERREEG